MKFKEVGHTYESNTGKRYRSVTGILKGLEPKKDWDKIATAYAKKNNLTVEEVKAKWQYEKDISIVKGSKYHASQEAKDLSLPFAAIMSSSESTSLKVFPPVIINGVKQGQIQVLQEGVYPELLLWLDSIELAGQADRVEIYNGFINIIDYKTSKKIEIEGYKNKFGMSEKLLNPCSHLDSTNYWIYALQLNMYAYMIQRHNPQLKIGKMILKHILFEDGTDIANGCKDFEMPNLQKEIHQIIKLIQSKKL